MMPGDPRMRASDADRDRAVQLLREHHAVGRLTAEEFDGRLGQVFTARTLGELDALLADMPAIDLYELPSAGIRPAQRAVRIRDTEHGSLVPQQGATWGTFAAASALLVAVWVTVGVTTGGLAWLPWFLLIIIPWAIAIARRPQQP
jgi:hypothetical protein